MRIQCDTLKYAKLMNEQGVEFVTANSFMSILPEIEIFNIHSKPEVDGMLSDSMKAVIAESRAQQERQYAQQEQKLAEQRREFDARMQERAQQYEQERRDSEQQRRDSRNEARSARRENRNELLAFRRWTIGTIITVGFSLAAYLSALIHFNH